MRFEGFLGESWRVFGAKIGGRFLLFISHCGSTFELLESDMLVVEIVCQMQALNVTNLWYLTGLSERLHRTGVCFDSLLVVRC